MQPKSYVRLAPQAAVKTSIRSLNDALLLFSGLTPVSYEPYSDGIEVYFLDPIREKLVGADADDPLVLSLEQLFIRYPPLEPIAYPSLDGFRGVYLWIPPLSLGKREWKGVVEALCVEGVKTISLTACVSNTVRRMLRDIEVDVKDAIYRGLPPFSSGSVDREVGLARLRRVVMMPVIGGFNTTALRVRLIGERFQAVIVYGVDTRTVGVKCDDAKLREVEVTASSGSPKELINKVKELLRECAPEHYDPLDLSYVNYCFNGRYITTSPLAQNARCPPCLEKRRVKNRGVCRDLPGLGRVHYMRRIFPRVYVRFNRGIEPRSKPIFKDNVSRPRIPFDIGLIDKLSFTVNVDSLEMYLPPRGGVIEVKLGVKPYARDPETEGIAVFIAEPVIDMALDLMLDYDGKIDYRRYDASPLMQEFERRFKFKPKSLKVEPYRIVATKFFIVKKYNNIYRFLEKLPAEFKSWNWYDELERVPSAEELKSKHYVEFKLFFGDAVSHTVAHIFYIAAATRGGMPSQYLKPVRSSVELGEMKYWMSALVESSYYGSLRLGLQAWEWLSSNDPKGDPAHGFARILRDYVKQVESAEREVSQAMRSEALEALIMLYDSYGVEKRRVLSEIVKSVETLLNALTGKGYYLDFNLFSMAVSYLLTSGDWISFASRRAAASEHLVEEVVKDVVDLVVVALGPAYGLDGSHYSIYLDKECSDTYMQGLTTSKIALKFLMAASGLLEPGGVLSFKGSKPMKRLISYASREVKISSAYVNMEALKFLEREVLARGIKTRLVLDDRNFESDEAGKLRNYLEELSRKYSESFSYEVVSGSHEKTYFIDDLKIVTSWNFMLVPREAVEKGEVKGPMRQSYSAIYIPLADI